MMAFSPISQLMECDNWMSISSPFISQIIVHENEDCGQTNISSNNTISNKYKFSDDWFIVFSWWFLHDIRIRWIE
ncbi:unnamed protein product [Paramecium octaurelia]|uniref:Uncharacterized protein n=1 Tax=Paramecium octaurelia TaxID=43137 RepID=A0A8S1TJU2_PAROT|nr:unnamed protein product [Paramecium octaurelia]